MENGGQSASICASFLSSQKAGQNYRIKAG
jgi:hypothetical protein